MHLKTIISLRLRREDALIKKWGVAVLGPWSALICKAFFTDFFLAALLNVVSC